MLAIEYMIFSLLGLGLVTTLAHRNNAILLQAHETSFQRQLCGRLPRNFRARCTLSRSLPVTTKKTSHKLHCSEIGCCARKFRNDCDCILIAFYYRLDRL